VAQEALAAGAAMINDISALRFDPEMASLAAREGVPVVLMHMKGTPENMQKNPVYKDVLGEIAAFLAAAVKRATAEGIAEELILVDPGIGFGKTFDHNLQIIRDLDRLHDLGRPLLFGSSNKAFIGRILDKGTRQRDTGTMATVAAAALKGAQVVRVHNVAAAVETVRIIDAVKRGRISEDEGGDL
jgi:dihydropteroate synthase